MTIWAFLHFSASVVEPLFECINTAKQDNEQIKAVIPA